MTTLLLNMEQNRSMYEAMCRETKWTLQNGSDWDHIVAHVRGLRASPRGGPGAGRVDTGVC